MFTHLRTNRCSISFSAVKLIKGECFADIITVKEWLVHPRKSPGAFSLRGLWLLCPHSKIIIHPGCEAMSPALICVSTES